MILWVAVGVVLAVATIAAIGLGVAMSRADRRARLKLYRVLGIPEDAIERLMARNGDVTAELAALRMSNAARDVDTPTGVSASADGSRIEPEAAPPWAATGARPAGPPEARRPVGARREAYRGRRHT
jgi:hypothetical protein